MVRTHTSQAAGGLLHVATVIAFVGMYLGLRFWIPTNLPAAELDNSIQLLGQVLALVVGVLLLGTTVSLSSYSGADTLSTNQAALRTATEPLFDEFLSGGSGRHKLDTAVFRRRLLLAPQVDTLLFEGLKVDDPRAGWFIYRLDWDGVWFQVNNSPFLHTKRTAHQLSQVQYLHETVLCAGLVIKSVAQLRSSGVSLLSAENGSNGTRWFIKAFDNHVSKKTLEVPAEMTLHDAAALVSLALQSGHYMREEFRDHSANIDWEPFSLTAFQLAYADYAKTLAQLVGKLQLLRWVNIVARYPAASAKHEDRISKLLWLKELNQMRQSLAEVRDKIVSAHGAARYFHSVKRWSVPGIGISLAVLLAVLCGWPFLRWAADSETRTIGFIVLYSAAIAALLQSSAFLARLLWKRRVAG